MARAHVGALQQMSYSFVDCILCVTEQQYFELEKQQLSDSIKLEAESKTTTELRSLFADLGKYSTSLAFNPYLHV